MLRTDCTSTDVFLLSEKLIKLYFSLFKEKRVCLVHFNHMHVSMKLQNQIKGNLERKIYLQLVESQDVHVLVDLFSTSLNFLLEIVCFFS